MRGKCAKHWFARFVKKIRTSRKVRDVEILYFVDYRVFPTLLASWMLGVHECAWKSPWLRGLTFVGTLARGSQAIDCTLWRSIVGKRRGGCSKFISYDVSSSAEDVQNLSRSLKHYEPEIMPNGMESFKRRAVNLWQFFVAECKRIVNSRNSKRNLHLARILGAFPYLLSRRVVYHRA